MRYVGGNEIPIVTTPNARWSIDFVHDRSSTGRALRVLTVVDDFSRECIALEVDFSFSGERVARIFDRVSISRSLPPTIKSDNGSEFTSSKLLEWSSKTGVELHFIEPGKPTKTPSLRASTVDFATSFSTSTFFQQSFTPGPRSAWRFDYNQRRSHTTLAGMTPVEFLKSYLNQGSQFQAPL